MREKLYEDPTLGYEYEIFFRVKGYWGDRSLFITTKDLFNTSFYKLKKMIQKRYNASKVDDVNISSIRRCY